MLPPALRVPLPLVQAASPLSRWRRPCCTGFQDETLVPKLLAPADDVSYSLQWNVLLAFLQWFCHCAPDFVFVTISQNLRLL